MSQVTEQSVRFQTALASIKLIQASAVLDLTEDDFDFLTSNKVWIATDRSRARRCVEACVYGTLDFVGYPRFPAPLSLLLPSLLIMFIPSTFKRPVSSWKALNLRKTLLMASSVRLKPLRSEERRVGKECRSRCTRHHYYKILLSPRLTMSLDLHISRT